MLGRAIKSRLQDLGKQSVKRLLKYRIHRIEQDGDADADTDGDQDIEGLAPEVLTPRPNDIRLNTHLQRRPQSLLHQLLLKR